MKKPLLLLALLCLFFISAKSQTWTPQGAGLFPNGYAIYSISVPNDSVVWLIASVESAVQGAGGVPANHLTKVARTTNGGETWQVHDVEEAVGRISFDIAAIDANTAWMTGQDYGSGPGRALFKTVDGGVTWVKITGSIASGVFVRLFDEQHIYAHNNTSKTWSVNGGQTWLLGTLNQYQNGEFNVVVSGNNMADTKGDTVWVGTSNGRIVRSTGYGASTEFFDAGFPFIQCVTFKDHLQGMLFWYDDVSNFGLARTFDGGATWEATPSQPVTNKEYNVTYVPGTPGTFMTVTNRFGNGSEVFWTTDFGETWTAGDPIEGAITNCIDFHSPTSGWIAKGGAFTNPSIPSVYKWSGDVLSHTTVPVLKDIKIQTFPSPFTETLQVQALFDEPVSGALEIYDITGQPILLEKIENQAFWNKTIPAQGWAPGAYLLQLRTAEGVAVRKILKQ